MRKARCQFFHRRRGAICLALGCWVVVPKPLAPAVITVGGACNLNAAILAANSDSPQGSCTAGSGSDTILLPANVELTVVDNTTDGPNGLPSVTSEIKIEGAPLFTSTISRSSSAPDMRILHVGETGDLTLEWISVAGGRIETYAGGGAKGGGLFNRGQLTLQDTSVSGNRVSSTYGSAQGGGIYNLGTTYIVGGYVDSNSASSGGGARGGGLFNASDGVLEISHTIVSNNAADSDTDNSGTTARGGGIYSLSSQDGSLAISNSSVSGNRASASAEDFASASGGGVDASALRLSNSTVSGNSASASAGPSDSASGGGVNVTVGTVRHTTFFGNRALGDPGEGAALRGGSDVSVSGSLFANSTGNHCSGAFTDAGGGNLADDTTCHPTIAAILTGLGLDPNLSFNGGPSLTHALLTGSPAIGAAMSCGLPTDQRGASRIAPCDSGAFEAIGCSMLQLGFILVNSLLEETTCSTALLGPVLTVGGSGRLEIAAGSLITVRNDFIVESGGELVLDIDPSLLPP